VKSSSLELRKLILALNVAEIDRAVLTEKLRALSVIKSRYKFRCPANSLHSYRIIFGSGIAISQEFFINIVNSIEKLFVLLI